MISHFAKSNNFGFSRIIRTSRFLTYSISPSGLKYKDLVEGTGEQPNQGDVVCVHYSGTLENGQEFDSSYKRGQPIEFPLGSGRVISGWDEGISTMRVGGKRQLIIPPHLGYGFRTMGPIPGGSTLLFDCELVKIGPAELSILTKLWRGLMGQS